jgi:hypothetical protein
MKKADLNKALVDMLDPIIVPFGFKKQKGGDGLIFRRNTGFGFNDISLLIWLYGDVSYVSLAYSIRIDQLNKIFIPYGEYVIHEKDETITLGVDIQTLGYQGDHKIKVESEEDLTNALQALQKITIEKGLSFFDQFTSVESIDRELNRENRPKNLYCNEIRHRPFLGITAAALNNNQNFSYWENLYREKLKNDIPQAKEKYEALVKHLKENVLKK